MRGFSPAELISLFGVTLKALVLGLVCVVAVCFIVSWAELVTYYIQIGILQFPPVVVGMLVFIVLANALIKRISRRFGLKPHEVMIIYCMMLVGAMIASRGLMEKLLPLLVTVNYFATPSNRWNELFGPHIPRWMVPYDPKKPERQEVVTAFFEGFHYGEPIPWGAWLTPLAAWGVFIILMFFAWICLATILRRQWVDNEKLPFPLVQLPLEMVREETAGAFLRNKYMWIGFFIPVAIFAMNGLHVIYPAVPEIPMQYNLNQHFVGFGRPWTDIYPMIIYPSFAAIGFSYMLPSDLLFSLWFFFLFTRFQDLIFSWFGMNIDAMPLYPCHIWHGYQVMGAYFILTIYLFRISLPHFRAVARKAFYNDPTVDDSGEFLSYRVAFWGLIFSTLGAIAWCYVAGMSLWLAVIEICVYLFVVVLVMARSVSEGGLLMTETSFRPVNVVQLFATKSSLGPANLTLISFLDASFTRDLRGLLLTGFLDGLKISDGVKLKRRHLLVSFVLAILVALIAACIIELWLPYRRGAITLYTYPYQGNNLWGFQDNAPAIEGTQPLDWRAPTFFAFGALFTLFLALMRANFSWWPFHPLGYALSPSWTMWVFWFPVLMAWIIKSLILRYGGMKAYAKARPFFLGLPLGEFTMAVIWTIFSSITKQGAPYFPWP